jgi:hypothetical protein
MLPPSKPDQRQEDLGQYASDIWRRHSVKVTKNQIWRGMLGLSFAMQNNFTFRHVPWNQDTFAVNYVRFEEYRLSPNFHQDPLYPAQFLCRRKLGIFGKSVTNITHLFPRIDWVWPEDPAVTLLIARLRNELDNRDQMLRERQAVINEVERKCAALEKAAAPPTEVHKGMQQKAADSETMCNSLHQEKLQLEIELETERRQVLELDEDNNKIRNKAIKVEASLDRSRERVRKLIAAMKVEESERHSTSEEKLLLKQVPILDDARQPCQQNSAKAAKHNEKMEDNQKIDLEQNEEAKLALDYLSSKLSSSDAEVSRTSSLVNKLNQELLISDEKFQKEKTMNARLAERLSLSKEELSNANRRIKELSQKPSNSKNSDSHITEIKTLRADVERLEKGQRDRKADKQKISDLSSKLTTSRQDVEELQSEAAESLKELISSNNKVKEAEMGATRLSKQLSISIEQLSNVQMKAAELSKHLSLSNEQLSKAHDIIAELSTRLSASKKEIIILETENIKLATELSTLKCEKTPSTQMQKKVTTLETSIRTADYTIAELTGALYASLSHLPRKNFKVEIETLRNHTLYKYEKERNASDDYAVRNERFSAALKISRDVNAYLTREGEKRDLEGEGWVIGEGRKRKRVD